MFLDRDKEPKIGSICIGTDREIKDGPTDKTYLFVYSDLLNPEGEWIYVCRIEKYSMEGFNRLFEIPDKYFEIILIDNNKYLAFGRCLVDYPEMVHVLYCRDMNE